MCPSPCPSLPHQITFFKRERVCLWFWGVPRSLNVMFLGWLRLQEPALKPQRGTPPLVPQRALSPKREGTDRAHTRQQSKKTEKKTQRAFYKRKYASCECWNQPMCTNWSQTSKKRRPAGTETGPNGPRKVTRRKPKSDSLPVYLAPISALKTCDNCCSNLFVNYCNQSDRGRDLILQPTDPSVSPP